MHQQISTRDNANKGGIAIGPSHAGGGIKHRVGNKTVEIEGEEIVICEAGYYSQDRLTLTGTPYEILMQIQVKHGCNTGKLTHLEPGEWVICKRVVKLPQKMTVTGTVKDIVNQLQSLGGCVVDINGCDGTCKHTDKKSFGGPIAASKINDKTPTFTDKKKRLRFEIDDSTAVIDNKLVNKYILGKYDSVSIVLKDILKEWAGYQYYPMLKNLEIVFIYSREASNGYFASFYVDKQGPFIVFNSYKFYEDYEKYIKHYKTHKDTRYKGKTQISFENSMCELFRSKLIHELQHAIQFSEGIPRTPSGVENSFVRLKRYHKKSNLSDSEFITWIEAKENRPIRSIIYHFTHQFSSEKEAYETEHRVYLTKEEREQTPIRDAYQFVNGGPTIQATNVALMSRGGLDGSILKPAHSLLEIALKHKVPMKYLDDQYQKGIEVEGEHTTDRQAAGIIARHHLWEMPNYYDELAKIEKKVDGGDITKESDIPIMDEETYLDINGASRQGIGDSALHKNKGNNSDKTWTKIVDAQAKKDTELVARRQKLREEYHQKIQSGEIKAPSRTQKLISIANGHPDNESVQAARRVLEKQGISWQMDKIESNADVDTLASTSTPTIEEEISKSLQQKQKSKEFKDTSTVNYTRKYQAAYDVITSNDLVDIEQDNVAAYKLIEKSKIWPSYNVNELKEDGNTSGAAYLKVKCREALSARPLDTKEARAVYVKNIEKLQADLAPLKTVVEVKDYLKEFINMDQFKFIDLSTFKPQTYSYTVYTGNLSKYSEHDLKKYFNEIFGVKFYNFCKISSDSAAKTFAEAILFEAFTQEQRDAYVNTRLNINLENAQRYEDLLGKIQAANDDESELRSIVSNSGLAFGASSFAKKYLSEYITLKINSYKSVTKESIENKLGGALVVREEDWNWSTPNAKKEVVKDEEGKPRKPQSIFEKYGLEQPKVLKRQPLDYIKRTGGLDIGDISTNAVVDNFGFRNIIYGNYVNDKESKEHTKNVLGAMLDLTELCNMSIKDINKLGGLDINIGSTGCGSFSTAAACYFPSLKAINVTKKRGDGSIAHEWSHYLDNILGEGGDKKATNIFYATMNPKELAIKSQRVAAMFAEYNNWLIKGGEERKVKVSFYPQKKFMYKIYGETLKEAIDAIQTKYPRYNQYANYFESDVYKYYGYLAYKLNDNQPLEVEMVSRASHFWIATSRYSPSDYYLSPKEIFARAFEATMEYKLEKLGRVNNYLVDVEAGMGMFALIIPRSEWPYPFGKDLEWLDDWFDKLFSAIRVDYGIEPFVWDTTERIDEYMEYEGKTSAKTDVSVIVTSTDEVIVDDDSIEEFEKGYGFRREYIKDKDGNNRQVTELMDSPYSRGKGLAVGGIKTGIFVISLNTFGLGSKGYAVANLTSNGIPTIISTETYSKIEEAKSAAIEYFKNLTDTVEVENIEKNSTLAPEIEKKEISLKNESSSETDMEFTDLKNLINSELAKETPDKYQIQQNVGALSYMANEHPELYGDFANYILSLPKKFRPTINPYDAEWGSPLTVEYLKKKNINYLTLLPIKEYKLPQYKPFETKSDNAIFMGIHSEFVGDDDLRPAMMGTYFDENGIASTDAHRLLFTVYREEKREEKGIYCRTKKCFEHKEEVEGAKYPNYPYVIPNNPIKVLINTAGLYNYLKNIITLGFEGNVTKAVGIYFKDAEKTVELAVNGIFLLESLSCMVKLGHTNLEFALNDSEHKGIVIYPKGNGDKVRSMQTDFALLMPIMDGGPGNHIYSVTCNIENGCMYFVGDDQNEYCFDLDTMERNRQEKESTELKSDLVVTKSKLSKLEEKENQRELARQNKILAKAEAAEKKRLEAEQKVRDEAEAKRKKIQEDLDNLLEMLEAA